MAQWLKGPKFGSQHPYCGSKSCVTLVIGDLVPSSGLVATRLERGIHT